MPRRSSRTSRVELREALDVRLVDDRLVPRRRAAAGRPPSRSSGRRRRTSGSRRRRPRRRARGRRPRRRGRTAARSRRRSRPAPSIAFAYGSISSLRRVEALPALGLVRPVDAVAVALARADAGQVAVPVERGALGQLDARLARRRRRTGTARPARRSRRRARSSCRRRPRSAPSGNGLPGQTSVIAHRSRQRRARSVESRRGREKFIDAARPAAAPDASSTATLLVDVDSSSHRQRAAACAGSASSVAVERAAAPGRRRAGSSFERSKVAGVLRVGHLLAAKRGEAPRTRCRRPSRVASAIAGSMWSVKNWNGRRLAVLLAHEEQRRERARAATQQRGERRARSAAAGRRTRGCRPGRGSARRRRTSGAASRGVAPRSVVARASVDASPKSRVVARRARRSAATCSAWWKLVGPLRVEAPAAVDRPVGRRVSISAITSAPGCGRADALGELGQHVRSGSSSKIACTASSRSPSMR